ncbi:MAG: LiaF domain-containing protein [Anaerolineae bacterium]
MRGLGLSLGNVSLIVAAVLLVGGLIGSASRRSSAADPMVDGASGRSRVTKTVLIDELLEPRNGATSALIDIHAGDGNLTVDGRASDELLAEGALEYTEKQGRPVRSLETSGAQTVLALRGGSGAPRSILPWKACYGGGATLWQLHLNPTVTSEVVARSDGGNLRVDLAGTTVTRATADTSGGNVELILPAGEGLEAKAKSGGGNVTVTVDRDTVGANTLQAITGAGNVTVTVPRDIAVRIRAKTGLGKVIMDQELMRLEDGTYETPDYASARNRIEITLESGAGNVSVEIP